mgnify:CR=1 FL=1
MSWDNLNLYNATIPSYKPKKGDSVDDVEAIDMDDPRNLGKALQLIPHKKK